MKHRRGRPYNVGVIPTGPSEQTKTFTERQFGLEPGDPAAMHILRAAGWLRLTWGVNVADHPELMAKAIEKGRRDYYHEQHWPAPDPKPIEEPVVYYVRIGKLIKIGTTRQLAVRLRAFPPDAVLLATEPGAYKREAQRHSQFRVTAATERGEYFYPSTALIEHINSLRETPLTAADLAA